MFRLFHSRPYRDFVVHCRFLQSQQEAGNFAVAPDIDKETDSQIRETFPLKGREEILIMRRLNADSILVLTNLGVYHNANKEPFSFRWKDISEVDGGWGHYVFLREGQTLFDCDAALFLFGLPARSTYRKTFFSFMQTLPRHRPPFLKKGTGVVKAFQKACTDFTENHRVDCDVDFMPEGFDLARVGYLFPDGEKVLMSRRSTFFSDVEFYITNIGLYHFDEVGFDSFRWDSILSITAEGGDIVFSDKSGNTRSISLNHILHRKKGLLESTSTYHSYAADFAFALFTVLPAALCRHAQFERASDIQKKVPFLDSGVKLDKDGLFKMRCPNCGSPYYALSDEYRKAKRKAELKGLGKELVSQAVGQLLSVNIPSYSSFDEIPEYKCSVCGCRWESEDESIL